MTTSRRAPVCASRMPGRRRTARPISARRTTSAASRARSCAISATFPNPGDIAFARPPATRSALPRELPAAAALAGRERGRARRRDLRPLAGGQHDHPAEPTAARSSMPSPASSTSKGLVTRGRTRRARGDHGTGLARHRAPVWSRRPGRDPDYRALMLRDGTAAAEALGAFMRGSPPLGVLANEPGLHQLVVCTLCSCYPRAVLGYPPFWFKSSAYRARDRARPARASWRSGARCCRTRRPHPRGQFDGRLSLDGAAHAARPARRAGRQEQLASSCRTAT